MDIQRQETYIRLARTYAAECLPWFAQALFTCKIHFSTLVPVAAIDQHYNVYFNPKAVDNILEHESEKDALEQLGFLWIHEIAHVLRQHGERAVEGGFDKENWNIAADLEINDSIWEGLSPPRLYPGVFPATYKLAVGELAETYYKLLFEKQEEEKKEEEASEKNSTDESENEQSSNLDADSQEEDQEGKSEGGSTGGNDEEADNSNQLNEGSGVHGQEEVWEVGTGVENKQELNELENAQIRVSVASEMHQQIQIGNLPKGWRRWIDKMLNPQIDWRKVLRHRLRKAVNYSLGAKMDYSFQRPSRRQSIYHPIITPRLSGDVKGQIVVVVDTSASITDRELSVIMGEVYGILKTFNSPVTIIPCDAKAYAPIKMSQRKDFLSIMDLSGGGGTNMIRGIEAALLLQPKADVVIVLTDGYTPYPKQLYKTPVLFGILIKEKNRQNYQRQLPPPPWTEDLVIEIFV